MGLLRGVLASLALVCCSTLAPGAATVWLETEQFRDLGGWVNDAQFVDQMGSPYLLAIGLDKPVADAVTETQVPAAGTYRLWVRSHDWVPEYSPGRFRLLLGGKAAGKTFGASKAAGWIWEDGGQVALPAGRLEVRLHDLTGHYGRCDAIVLSSDPAFQPPTDSASLAEARERFSGVSRTIQTVAPYDTVVVGGGLAGCFAAVSSARMGCRTALLQNRPVLGGNTSSEVLVEPEGDTTREPLDPGEGGIIEEVRGKAVQYSPRLLKLVQSQPNLDLYLNTHVTGARLKAPGEIAAVEALEVTSGKRLLVPGTIFIDCTGDGALGFLAGAEYRHGREPRSMYNESRAPEQGDLNRGTMGGTLRYATEVERQAVSFTGQEWARKFDQCGDFGPDRHPQLRFGGWQWVIEYGGMRDTVKDAEAIRDELLRIIWGMWDHAKNHCPKLAREARDFRLVWVSHVVGKRESRRLVGDYVMTEHDIGNRTLFADRVSYGGWGIDLHPPGGFYDPGPPAVFSHKFKFSVPYRSLYSRNVNNLMMAGRCISVSHAALGATRVMITCGLQGQAAGTAAGLCRFHQTTPRGISQSYVGELQQQLLKDGCYLIDLPNQDPKDLARAAGVAASSVSPPVDLDRFQRRTIHALDCDRAVMFKTTGNRLEGLSVYVSSKNPRPTRLTLGLRPAKNLSDYSAEKDLASATAEAPANGKGWVKFRIGAALEPGYYYAWLSRAPGVSWWLADVQPAETSRAYSSGRGAWNIRPEEAYRFQLDPPAKSPSADSAEPARPREKMFAAENVTNGFARAIRGWPNSWRPDPKQPLPQWVELDFGRPVAFNAVHVAFQSREMRADAFRLQVPQGETWRNVAEVKENERRRQVLAIDRTTASKLRLVIDKAREDMGVCEIRVYDEPGR